MHFMISRMTRRTATASAPLALALLLAGCGGDGSSTTADATTSPKSSASPSVKPSASSSTNADGTAAPGTKAKLGAPTLLTYDDSTNKGTLQVTITRIVVGRQSDLAALSGLSADARKATPFYVHATIKNAGTTDLSHSPIDAPNGLLDDGSPARKLSVIGTFDTCDSFPKTKSFPPGASYETCMPVLADPGTKVTGAVWSGSGYPDFPATSGVIWTR